METKKIKFLGLTIDWNLSWNKHVDDVLSKASSGLCALWQMSKMCNLVTMKIIFHYLIQSNMSYGLCIYGTISEGILDKILSKQN